MRTILLLLACAAACLAQLDDNTVSVTVTRIIALQPDQATISATVTTPTAAGLDDALPGIAAAGFTAADLTYVNTSGPGTNWQFSKAVPFSDLKTVLPALATAQQSVSSRTNAVSLSYFVGSQSSQAAEQAPANCPVPTLFADAQAQAQLLATISGGRLGAVVSLSQASSANGTISGYFFDSSALFAPLQLLPLTRVIPAASPCSLTVQFRLVH
jgi:hypothetical protein